MDSLKHSARAHRIVVVAFPKVQSLDVIGLIEVFAEANRQVRLAQKQEFLRPYIVELAAPSAGPLETSSGVPISASLRIEDVRGQIDTLVFGSGQGARDAAGNGELIASMKQLARSAQRVASVCTGAFPLAATGLLDGRRATTHWARAPEFAQRFSEVKVEPDAIFISDGKFHTSAGGTSGIDLALALVEDDLGRSISLAVARQLVVFLKRPGGQSQFSGHLMAEIEGQTSERFAALARWMLDHLDENLSVESLAEHAAMSPRNFARRFRTAMGTTPAQYVQRLRIELARRLLTEGGLPTSEIAARCGFGALETMRIAFQRHFHVAPQQFRERFRPINQRSSDGRPAAWHS